MEFYISLSLLILAAAAIFLYALYLRYRRRELQHKERLLAIEKGGTLPETMDAQIGPRFYLLRGMIWMFVGIALSVFLLAISITTHRPKPIEQRIMQAKMIEQMGGNADQVRHLQNDTTPREVLPIAFALVGLVPIGVGLAYLIVYRTEKITPSNRKGKNE